MVAKYLDNDDTYMSVVEALRSASWNHGIDFRLTWVDAEALEKKKDVKQELKKYDGLVVPGGFGKRGVEGKVIAARYAMDNKKPYLGLCLGLQVGVIAAVRKAGFAMANSIEIDPETPDPVIHLMTDQAGKENTGGTMRLGDYDCDLKDSITRKLYGKKQIVERHRHRYEVNNDYREILSSVGLDIVGTSPDGELVEMVELSDHPFFLATQAHPEFKSRPNRPHPLFSGFIKACKDTKNHK